MSNPTASGWKDVERPAYYGAQRDQKFREYDNRFGKGNWRLTWRVGPLRVDRLAACALYEDAYFHFLTTRSDVLDRLISQASNVYDDAVTNVESGFDYAVQETDRTHVQDIAIRRCLLRLGRWFEGKELIQIRDKRGTHPLSMTLSPGQVPFHLPNLLAPFKDLMPDERWFNERSVEDFYQRNRYLQART